MAYTSNESGHREVYVRSFPGPGGQWQISNEEGSQPLWARSGKRLFYRGNDSRRNQVWVVDVQSGSGFAVGKPRLVFERSGFAGAVPVRGWDISPDGKRFLMVKMEERKPQPITELIFVQNWSDEIKRLAPTAK